MAGKIIADQIEHSTAGSLSTEYVVNGSAKAWVNFDGTASSIAARDSFNIASITDNGTGQYTANFSNSMTNDDFAHNITVRLTTGSGAAFGSISCLLYTSPSPRDKRQSRMPSSA